MYILKAYYYCFAFLNPFILEKNPTDTDIKTIYLIGNTISIYFLVKWLCSIHKCLLTPGLIHCYEIIAPT